LFIMIGDPTDDTNQGFINNVHCWRCRRSIWFDILANLFIQLYGSE
jgi:hypothetical protein